MENRTYPFSIHNFLIKLNTLFKFEYRNNHVTFLTGKNIKLRQFIQQITATTYPVNNLLRNTIMQHVKITLLKKKNRNINYT
jgi:hypothetical protein